MSPPVGASDRPVIYWTWAFGWRYHSAMARSLIRCPLCAATGPIPFAEAQGRSYYECARCRLVAMAPGDRPSAQEERARYEMHENHPDDPGYRGFLNRLAAPLIDRLPAGAEGLDYGSGPGPALSRMLREAGHPTAIYDPFFAPDRSVLDRTYRFITCTETAEHFHAPGKEFERMNSLLRPGGWLGLMTEVRDASQPFESWWYTRDATHVCFYSADTFGWIGRHFGWELERPHRNVALFRKPAGQDGTWIAAQRRHTACTSSRTERLTDGTAVHAPGPDPRCGATHPRRGVRNAWRAVSAGSTSGSASAAATSVAATRRRTGTRPRTTTRRATRSSRRSNRAKAGPGAIPTPFR